MPETVNKQGQRVFPVRTNNFKISLLNKQSNSQTGHLIKVKDQLDRGERNSIGSTLYVKMQVGLQRTQTSEEILPIENKPFITRVPHTNSAEVTPLKKPAVMLSNAGIKIAK